MLAAQQSNNSATRGKILEIKEGVKIRPNSAIAVVVLYAPYRQRPVALSSGPTSLKTHCSVYLMYLLLGEHSLSTSVALGSYSGVDTICGLSLLLVLSFAAGGFSPGTSVFPSPQKPTLQTPIQSGKDEHV